MKRNKLTDEDGMLAELQKKGGDKVLRYLSCYSTNAYLMERYLSKGIMPTPF